MSEINALKEYKKWLSSDQIDDRTKEELRSIESNPDEITDRFYKKLSFGTGGLRGVIGAGTNRMNIYTVRQATQGLADYILSQKGQDKGVAIAHDSRLMSPEFAREAALCLNANGIRTYLFESLRPTPELSFAVRELHCIAGIVITASHNPREYNGYKVYWEDGAQITPPHDKNIMAEVAKVTDFSESKTMAEDDARANDLFHVIGTDFDDRYIAEVKKQSIHPEIIPEMAKDMTIVYTPLHGTGNVPVRRVLRQLGFTKVYVEPQQKIPDGRFPTVAYPNPEDPKAWTLALDLAKKVDADLVLATDPDADRLGVYCKDTKTGQYVSFTGNMSGMLIADYILRERTLTHTMPEKPALVETIVTTDMAKEIAAEYHVDLIEVLTGFKYIGEQIKLFEKTGSHHFVFGLEESYGCLAGTYARDKDSVVAVMMLCEAAAFYKKQGKTLWDAMTDLYEKYGYYKEGLTSVELKGMDGAKKIDAIMDHLRNEPVRTLGCEKVLAVRDYRNSIRKELDTGKTEKLTLPESNVLYYELSGKAWCCARPSGTEPKIKFYYGVKGTSLEDAEKRLEVLKNDLLEMTKI